jgi:predicted GNAT superfamily acetyltransferase
MTREDLMIPLERTVAVGDRRFLLRVETSREPEDYGKYEDLREETWGFVEDHMAGTRNMMCENVFYEGASLFIGAFAEARGGFEIEARNLAGFCYGYVGVRDLSIGFRDRSNLRFYSQFTAVRQAYQSFGLGILLKEFQREAVLDILGVSTAICTFDPLTGVNAHRNVHYFGMDVLEYRVATYGECGGHLNRTDVPTDRFLMSWDLERRAARPDYDWEAALAAPCPIRAAKRRVAGRSSMIELEVVEATNVEASGDPLLVPIPLDFYRMLRETDVPDGGVRRIPVDWRMATRAVFQALLARGYRIVDFRKAGAGSPASQYVMSRSVRADR